MNTGNIAFVLICALLIFFMTPGLAFFYGGLSKHYYDDNVQHRYFYHFMGDTRL